MIRLYVGHDSIISETWLACMRHMTPSYASHEAFTLETRCIHIWDMPRLFLGHDSFISETWLAYMWHMTHPSAKHEALTCDTRLLHMWVMTHSPARHDSFTFWTRLIHMCDMPNSYWRVQKCVSLPSMSAFWRSHVSHTNKPYILIHMHTRYILIHIHTFYIIFRGTRVCPWYQHFEACVKWKSVTHTYR